MSSKSRNRGRRKEIEEMFNVKETEEIMERKRGRREGGKERKKEGGKEGRDS